MNVTKSHKTRVGSVLRGLVTLERTNYGTRNKCRRSGSNLAFSGRRRIGALGSSWDDRNLGMDRGNSCRHSILEILPDLSRFRPKILPRLLIRRLVIASAALCVAGLVLIVTTAVVFAETRSMTAPAAFEAMGRDEVIVLDIRTPAEWAESGVAQGALPVSMHSRDFGANLSAILTLHPDKQLALICATGGRSGHVAAVLAQNGIADVIDISEGMFGNGTAPGWIARGLPVVDAQSAVVDTPLPDIK